MALSTPVQDVSTVSTSNSQTGLTSAAFLPTANSLLLVVSTSLEGNVNVRAATGCSGTHATFTEITQKWQGSANRSVLTCAYWGIVGPSPSSDTVRVFWSGSANRTIIQVYEITGHNVSSPIGFFGNVGSTGSSQTVTLSGTPLTPSTVIGVAGTSDDTSPNDITEDGTYTALSQVDSGGSTARAVINVSYDANSADNTVAWSNMPTLSNCSLAFEVREAGGTTFEDSLTLTRALSLTASAVTTIPTTVSMSRALSLAMHSTGTFPGLHTFTDGYQGDAESKIDTLMSAGWPLYNGGAHESADLDPINPQRFLMRFNLSSIPSTFQCVDATLYLYRDQGGEGGGICSGSVYSISAANSSWIEGTKNIALAGVGEPCWNALAADGASGTLTAWAGSFGCSTAGTDYETNSIGNYSFLPADPAGTEIAISLNPERVEDWFGPSNTNYGIILVTGAGSNNAHVGSSDNPTIGYRPKLVVHYTGEPVTYDESISLNVVRSFTASVLATYYTDILLNVAKVITTAASLDIPVDLSLNRMLSITTESIRSIEESLSLTIAKNITTSAQLDAVASIGLTIQEALDSGANADYLAALSMARQLSVQMDAQLDMQAAISLVRQIAILTASEIGNQVIEAELVLARTLAITTAAQSVIESRIDLTNALSVNMLAALIIEGVLGLGIGQGISDTNNADLVAQLSMGRSVSLSTSVQATLDVDIQLGRVLSVNILGGLQYDVALSLGIVQGLTTLSELIVLLANIPAKLIIGDRTVWLISTNDKLAPLNGIIDSDSPQSDLNIEDRDHV